MDRHPTERFTNRVKDYTKFRPGYPEDLIGIIETKVANFAPITVADIGSGTGKFTRLLLKQGYNVYGVEPNEAMRKAGKIFLAQYPNFISIDGQAEQTTLESKSVDLITAAQAFHWFKEIPSKQEFSRILKPEGFIAFIWNERMISTDAFQKEYNEMLYENCPEYHISNHRNVGEKEIARFIKDYEYFASDYVQHFDFAGLEGRLFSSSYTPSAEDPSYNGLKKAVKRLFLKYQINGVVKFSYKTCMYIGKLAP